MIPGVRLLGIRAGLLVIPCLLMGSSVPSEAQAALPHITAVAPSGGQRGTTVELTVSGINIGRGTGLIFEGAGLTVESVTPEKLAQPAPPKPGEKPAGPPKNPAGKLVARVRLGPDAPLGIHAMRVLTPLGPSDIARFVVGQWPEIAEKEPNNTAEQAQIVRFPVTVNGRIDPAEDIDVFRFHAEAGHTLVFDLLAARLDSPLDSTLSLQDAGGRELAFNDDFNGTDSLLAFTAPTAGDYFLFVRDLHNQGSANHTYRLSMGEFPYVTGIFPMGGRPGATVPVELLGFNLGAAPTTRVTLPADAAPGAVPMTLALPAGVSNPVTLAVGEAPELMEVEPNDDPARAQRLPVPGTVNGRISPPSGSSGPDIDCYRFRAAKGQKLVLEVIARRYGSALDSLLAVTDAAGKELAVNDDAVGKDSRLEFTAPETGEYIARITDLQDRGGPEYAYRFSITLAVPNFRLTFTSDRLAVGQGGRVPLAVTAERLNGFDGEIAVEVSGLPEGVSVVGPARIRAGRKETRLVLTAAPDAALQATAFQVTGTATIDGKAVRRAAQGMEEIVRNGERVQRPAELLTAAVTEPPDLVVTAAPEKLALSPGQAVAITVTVARKPGFTGKVPLEVLGLPNGVTADAHDVPENQTEAKITLKAEDKVAPGETEIVVVAKSQVDGLPPVLHAALPITLAVTPAETKQER